MTDKREGLWKRLTRYFLAGIFAILPLIITVLAVTWVVGLLTGLIGPKGREHQVVLVPQSPVPIGGGLLFVPTDSIERVQISVDTFMSIYVSMGVTAPGPMRNALMDDRFPGDGALRDLE